MSYKYTHTHKTDKPVFIANYYRNIEWIDDKQVPIQTPQQYGQTLCTTVDLQFGLSSLQKPGSASLQVERRSEPCAIAIMLQ